MVARAEKRRLGDEAEQAAVEHLQRAGYRVRARNFSCKYGELDIVAERGDTFCFVEVRMRSTAAWGDPSHTVSYGKQRKVVRAALHYLFAHDVHDKVIRFDVVSVIGRGRSAQIE